MTFDYTAVFMGLMHGLTMSSFCVNHNYHGLLWAKYDVRSILADSFVKIESTSATDPKPQNFILMYLGSEATCVGHSCTEDEQTASPFSVLR